MMRPRARPAASAQRASTRAIGSRAMVARDRIANDARATRDADAGAAKL